MRLVRKVELASIEQTIEELNCPLCGNEELKIYDAYGDEFDLNARLELYEKGDGRPINYYCSNCNEYFEDYITVVD